MATTAAVLSAGPAMAQAFGSAGDVVFAGERLFGIQGTHVFQENQVPAEPDYENDYTTINFGWRGPLSPDLFSPFDPPRLGFDVFVIDRLSVGGSLGWASGSVDNEDTPVVDTGGYNAFIFSPRVGYCYMFSEVIGIWPRGGVAYHSSSVDDVYSDSGFSLGIEAMFPIVPVRHFGFLIGPTFDIDLTGTRDPEVGSDVDRTYRSFGLQVGLFGWI
jgi:hypothetical protein